jgi:hypothetical protein
MFSSFSSSESSSGSLGKLKKFQVLSYNKKVLRKKESGKEREDSRE